MISPFCPKCKYKLGSGSSVCPICGTDISDPSNFENNGVPELDKRIYDVHFRQRSTIKPKLNKRKEKNEPLIFLGIVCLIIIVLIVILITSL